MAEPTTSQRHKTKYGKSKISRKTSHMDNRNDRHDTDENNDDSDDDGQGNKLKQATKHLK